MKDQIKKEDEKYWIIKALKKKLKKQNETRDKNAAVGALLLLMEHHGCSQNKAAEALAAWLNVSKRYVSKCFYDLRNIFQTSPFLTSEKKININLKYEIFPEGKPSLQVFHIMSLPILHENKQKISTKFPDAFKAFEAILIEGISILGKEKPNCLTIYKRS